MTGNNNNREQHRSVADEGTRLLAADSAEPRDLPLRRERQARNILLSTVLSRLGSRTWEFATPLLLLEWSPGSLMAPAVFGLANALCCTVVGPVLGKRADGWDRFRTVLVGTGAQAAGCLASIGALVLWNGLQQRASDDDDAISESSWGHFVSLSIVVLAGVVEALGASLATVAVKREWVPIIFGDDEAAGQEQQQPPEDATSDGETTTSFWKSWWRLNLTLSFMNTTMTNIDLCAAMFGPVLAGWIIQLLVGPEGGGGENPLSSSMQRGFIAIALLNILSFAPEAFLLRRVYDSCLDLRLRASRDTTDNKPADEDQNSWKLWLSHPSGLQLLSISLASLYLTVLSPSSVVLTAYLVTAGLAPTSIGTFRAIGALSGVCGIGLFSLARHWGEDGTSQEEGAAGHAAAKSIDQLRRVSSGFLFLEVVSVILAAIAFSRCDTPGMIARHQETMGVMAVVPAPLYAFLGFVCVSRAGLYSFDVGALEIEQQIVDERYRNAIGSVESGMCSLVWMMVFVMSIVIPDPADFGIQVWTSAIAVTVGWLCFVAFLVLYLNHGHYHREEGDGEEGDHHHHHHHEHHIQSHSHIHEHTSQQEKELRSCNGFHIHLHRHHC